MQAEESKNHQSLKKEIQENDKQQDVPTKKHYLRNRSQKNKKVEDQMPPLPKIIPVSNQQTLIWNFSEERKSTHLIIQLPLVLWLESFQSQYLNYRSNQHLISFRIRNKDSSEYLVLEMKIENMNNQQQFTEIWGKLSWVTKKLESKLIKKTVKKLHQNYTDIFKYKISEVNSDIFIDLYFEIENNKKVQYNGLINQGNTCYMNSYLQMLYHLSKLKKIIFSMKQTQQNKFPGTLQSLFFKLSKDNKSVSTQLLSKSYGWSRRETGVQQDVQQFSCLFFDVLQRKINQQQKTRGMLNQLFEGLLIHYIECIDVEYKSLSKERFFDLQLNITGMKNLEQSLDQYITPEILEGENMYRTENNGHQKARKGVFIEKMPPVLMIQLKRFQFDPQTERNEKVLDRYQYPQSFDFSKYVRYSLPKYKLYAVLVHQGRRSSSGHYYAYLNLKNQWHKFNDEVVTIAEHQQVFEHNFGGTIQVKQLDHKQLIIGQKTISIQSTAYMLVYYNEQLQNEIFFEDQQFPSWLLEEQKNKVEEEKQKKKKNQCIKFEVTQWNLIKNTEVVSGGLFNQLDVINYVQQQTRYFNKLAQQQLPKELIFKEYIDSIIVSNKLNQDNVTFWILDTVKEKQILTNIYPKKQNLTIGQFFKDSHNPILLILTQSNSNVIHWNEQQHIYEVNNQPNNSDQQMNGSDSNQSLIVNYRQDKIYVCFVKLYLITEQNQLQFQFDKFFYIDKSANSNQLLSILQELYPSDGYSINFYYEQKKFGLNPIQKEKFLTPTVNKSCMIRIIVEKISLKVSDPQTLSKNFEDKKNKILVSIKSDDWTSGIEAEQHYLSKDLTINQLRQYIFCNVIRNKFEIESPQHIIIKAKQSKSKAFVQVFQGSLQNILKIQKTIRYSKSKMHSNERQNNQMIPFIYRFKSLQQCQNINIKIEKKAKTGEIIQQLKKNQIVAECMEIEQKNDIQILLMDSLKQRILRIYKEDQIVHSTWSKSKGFLIIEGFEANDQNIFIFCHHKTKTSDYIGTPIVFAIFKSKSISEIRKLALIYFKQQVFKFQDKLHNINENKIKMVLYSRDSTPAKGTQLTEENQTMIDTLFPDNKQLNLEITHINLSRTVQTMKIQV